MSSSQVSQAQQLRTLRLVAGAMATAIVFIALVTLAVLPYDVPPPLLAVIVVVVVGFAIQPSSWFSVGIGGVISLLLWALAWPGVRATQRICDNLERDGGHAWLRTQLP